MRSKRNSITPKGEPTIMNYRDEFEKIIQNIEVNSKTPQDEFNVKMQPMLQLIQKNVPAQLYKFRECTENNLGAFENDEIWLSKASLFNDLHDSLLFFDKTEILAQAKQIFSPENVSAIYQSLKQSQSFLNQFSFQNTDIHTAIINGLNTLDENSFCNMVQQLVPNLDIFLESCFKSLKNDIRNQTKMACLSRSIKSPLMWAHYANNHKGFAIEYDFRGNNISQCANCPNRSCPDIKLATIYPIIYSDNRFDATQYGKWYIEQYMKMHLGIRAESVFKDEFLFTKAALYKSNDWEYEDEWRIICSTPNLLTEQKDCYPIKKKPTAIYFGSQISDIYRNILTRIADEKGIAKYQVYVEDYNGKYELNYKPV